MKKNFNTPITVISLIACYFSAKYIMHTPEQYNLWFILPVLCIFLLHAWTIYFGIREKTFLILLKLIVLIITFPTLGAIGIINAIIYKITGKELHFLFKPVHWILTWINKSIKK